MDHNNMAHLLRFGVLKPHNATRRSLSSDSFSGPSTVASYNKPKNIRKRDVEGPIPEKDLNLYMPKDREEWMQFVIDRVKQKVAIQYSTDKELEMTILRAKKVLSKKVIKLDPDMPDCYYWSVDEVGSWIEGLGFPDVQKMFHANSIAGRLLVRIDASALNQMGLRDLSRMKEVTKEIRKLLAIPAPNAMRAIMRLVPWELYLKRKSRTGPITDALTFKEFCRQEGFLYEIIMRRHKSSVIPPVCIVEVALSCPDKVSTLGAASSCRASSSGSSSSSGSNNSLKYCHTTEQIVRKLPGRDAIIQQVLTTLLQAIIDELKIREANALAAAGVKKGHLDGEEGLDLELDLEERVRRIYLQAYLDLAIRNPEKYEDQVKFVAEVTLALVSDIMRTREVFQDMEKFQRYMEESLEVGLLLRAREIAGTVLEEVSPIAALLSLGQLEPEAVIRQAPGILAFVKDILNDAEKEIDDNHRHEFQDASSSDVTRVPSLLAETRERLLPMIKKSIAS